MSEQYYSEKLSFSCKIFVNGVQLYKVVEERKRVPIFFYDYRIAEFCFVIV